MTSGGAPLRIGIDARELREGVRTGIRRYVVEVVRAAAARGLECVVYGDRGTRLPPTSSAVRPVTLAAGWTQWWGALVGRSRIIRVLHDF